MTVHKAGSCGHYPEIKFKTLIFFPTHWKERVTVRVNLSQHLYGAQRSKQHALSRIAIETADFRNRGPFSEPARSTHRQDVSRLRRACGVLRAPHVHLADVRVQAA